VLDDAQGNKHADVLIEGSVDSRNRRLFLDFVAFVREELRPVGEHLRWHEDQRETPPLFIKVADGVVTVEAYVLQAPPHTWSESTGEWKWTRRSGGTKQYRGLWVGDTVTVLGSLAAGRAGPVLTAEFAYGGARENYLVKKRREGAQLNWVGGIAILFGLAVFAALLSSRRADAAVNSRSSGVT